MFIPVDCDSGKVFHLALPSLQVPEQSRLGLSSKGSNMDLIPYKLLRFIRRCRALIQICDAHNAVDVRQQDERAVIL